MRSTAASTAERVPVNDATFEAWNVSFNYDANAPLNARVEEVDAQRVWRREKITFDAAYGDERAILYLYLPPDGTQPLQTVVYWSGWDTFRLDDVDHYFARQIDFIVKSGRAVAFPIFPGTFERRTAAGQPPFNTPAWRENTIAAVKDVRRTIDYLETRRDIDTDALAFFGYSWGGASGPAALAQEDRFKAAVIYVGVLPDVGQNADVDPVNSLPRIRIPTLLFSGEFDPIVPRSDAERYFDLIGVDDDLKNHIWEPGGHFVRRDRLISETWNWLDTHLGTTT